MWILFCAALLFTVGRCTDDQSVATKTARLGGNVILTCNHQSNLSGQLFWIRLVAGKFPEVLVAIYTFDNANSFKGPRFTATKEPGAFVLHLTKIELSDAAFYYCEQVVELKSTFLNKTFLQVKGPESDITAVPPSDAVLPGDSVTLQCSVFSESNTCPGGHSVHWFRAGSHGSHPSLKTFKSPEVRSPQKCVYSFSKTVSSSDAGTYFCAVATCGEILFGNGTKLDIEGVSIRSFGNCQSTNTVVFLLCVAFVISLGVIASLIYIIKKNNKTSNCCKGLSCYNPGAAAAALQGTTTGVQQSQQIDEDMLLYSVPDFTRGKAGRSGRRSANPVMGESIYSAIRVLK